MFDKIIENFTLGDFIYGFKEDRATAINALNEHYPENEREPFIVDDYNTLAQYVWHAFNGNSSLNLKSIKISGKAKELHDFSGKFEDTDNHNYRGYYNSLANAYSQDAGITCDFIKKRCKLGILWQIQNGRKVHFLLSERVNFDQCFKEKKDKYTYSELRFVYRNWNDLLPYYQEGLIKFWKKDDVSGHIIEVPPPWQSDPNLVKGYVPRTSTEDRRIEKRKKYSAFFSELNSRKKVATVQDPAVIDQSDSSHQIPIADQLDNAIPSNTGLSPWTWIGIILSPIGIGLVILAIRFTVWLLFTSSKTEKGSVTKLLTVGSSAFPVVSPLLGSNEENTAAAVDAYYVPSTNSGAKIPAHKTGSDE